MDIQNMSNRQLEDIIHQASVELQDREYRIYEDALTHRLSVGECEPKYRQGYIDWLAEVGGCGETPAAQDILDEWYSEQDIIQSRRTTGA